MKFLKSVLMFACLVLPLMMLCQDANADPGKKKAKTIDELAARYDVSSCKECHEEIYEEWEKSLHSRSIFGTGRTAATLKTAITNGLMTWPYSGVKKGKHVLRSGVELPFDLKTIKVEHFMMCAKCHLPQLIEATDDVMRDIVETAFTKPKNRAEWDEIRKKLSKLSINCLVCHQRNAIVHKWVDGFPEKDVLYGKEDMEHESEEYPTIKKNPIMSESIVCGQCHGTGPNFEFENPSMCAALYGSYLFNYVFNGGHETCQDCHMTKFNKGHVMPAYRDLDMGKAAIELKVDGFSYHWRKTHHEVIPLAVLKVEMTNKTGHSIPDG